jgi:hypothetical protein
MSVRIDHSPERTVVRDIPRGMWAFGSVFVCSGLFVLIAAPLSAEWADFSILQRLGMLVVGLGHLAGGCYLVWRYEATVTTFDHLTGEGTHEVRRPFRRAGTVTRFQVADVRTIEVLGRADDEGGAMYQLRLWLAGSRVLPLQGEPSHGVARGERDASAIRAALRLPLLAGE